MSTWFVGVCLLCLLKLSRQNIITCSGKIKTDFKLNYSRINIQLLSKSGSLIDKSDCAPNNGYFVVPLYDKGDYVIRVAPPTGWGFDPSEVTVSFDGETDICSTNKDIFFQFTGFTISGQINTINDNSGPYGVRVNLKGNEIHKDTKTLNGGVFHLSNVLPGEYRVIGSHPSWTVSKDPVPVIVVDDSLILQPNSIVVEGYDVKGSIKSDGEPVAHVYFLLYTINKDNKFTCDLSTNTLLGLTDPAPSCIVVSSSGGVFKVSSVPPGQYRIVPHYRSGDSTYQVSPNEAFFTVTNDSVTIEPSFEVQGFSVFGSIVHKPSSSEGLSGASIIINGVTSATTNTEGKYQINNITAGIYTVEVKAPNVEFDPLRLSLSPSNPQIPSINPSRYLVSGEVKIIVHRSTQRFQVNTCCSIDITEVVGDTSIATTSVNSEGLFSVMLAPGKYHIKIITTSEDTSNGLYFRNTSLPLTVWYSPIEKSQLVFRQFTGKLTAKITCLGLNQNLEVNLVSTSHSFKSHKSLNCIAREPSVVNFDRLLPGQYKISISADKESTICWRKTSHQVTIPTSLDVAEPAVTFIQSGFNLKIKSSHKTDVLVSSSDDKTFSKIFKLRKGQNDICLEKQGDYSIVPRSCYTFDGDLYMFMTSLAAPIVMTAIGHRVSVTLNAPLESNINIKVESKDVDEQILQPLKRSLTNDNSMITNDNTLTTYEYSFTSTSGDVVSITPLTTDLICEPLIQTHRVGDLCPEYVPVFNCSKGLFIKGVINPPIEGVGVTVTINNEHQLNVVTGKDGRYTVGPVPAGVDINIDPKLDQYVFNPIPAHKENQFNFEAVKVSRIIIKIISVSNGDGLVESLISISGDEYRSTDVASDKGTVVYNDLHPGEYYLKPILREYEFTPLSKVIVVDQGEDLEVVFTGRRVAFSVNGKVMSLNRTPLLGIPVQIQSIEGQCDAFKETTVSDNGGQYSFRGIMPSCDYHVSVVTMNEDAESVVEAAIPKQRFLQVTEDSLGQDFVSILKPSQLTVTGNIISSTPEYLPTLKVVVYSDTFMDTVLYSTTPDSLGFFTIILKPNAPLECFVRVESSLSSHYYTIEMNSTSFSTVTDTNNDNHITLYFTAQASNNIAESSSKGSFMGILVAIGTIFVLFNLDKVIDGVQPSFISKWIKKLQLTKKHKRR